MKTDFTIPEHSSKGFLDTFMIWWSLISEAKIKAKLASWANERVNQNMAQQSESASNSNDYRNNKQLTYPEWKTVFALKKNAFTAGTTRKNSVGLPHSELNDINVSELESNQQVHCLNNENTVVAMCIQDGNTFFKMMSTLRVMPYAETKRVLKTEN